MDDTAVDGEVMLITGPSREYGDRPAERGRSGSTVGISGALRTMAGKPVRIVVVARRFQWAVLWGRRIFAERFDGDVLAPWARRTARLDQIVHHLGLAPGALGPNHRAAMTIGRDSLTKSETVTVATIEVGVPLLVEAREIVAGFQAMIRKKTLADLEPWLERARSSLVASFANGVLRDRSAVSAAITSPWSNGQTEGQITKLKLVKRQMYGRGKLDLLQARVIGAG
ncbi:putative transposase [Mesorhizobium amorphae CCNWGS0123]|uniref:Putative transposase n=1 Tax=Mesorhizobium amorphae CCNWGS0123 TaxID=1082933 RepID=G6Y492_9HYPH|nr:putative transposase [Mesorhizobium amorphae CCNWGS0123]